MQPACWILFQLFSTAQHRELASVRSKMSARARARRAAIMRRSRFSSFISGWLENGGKWKGGLRERERERRRQ